MVSLDSAAFLAFLESSFQQVYEMRDVSRSTWLIGPVIPLTGCVGHFVLCMYRSVINWPPFVAGPVFFLWENLGCPLRKLELIIYSFPLC